MEEIGIRQTHDKLIHKLTDYIKAQYFAENDLLMDVAEELLDQKKVIYQEPYIEVTKNYKSINSGFINTKLDEKRKKILDELTKEHLGVFSMPFSHQVKSVEAYYDGKSVLVTTGTGSGKTECFLWPIVTNLIYEAKYQKASWEQEGIRALILYPMNALVSDQLGRMRKIIGREDDALFNIAADGKNIRRPRFGMYTGRTPYAGKDDNKKNRALAKLIQQNYIDSAAHTELIKIGRIPSKNLNEFVDNLLDGKQITGERDSELYTRGEMQKICPDILITNYSMLEYMLMRPIENNFWDKTVQWLNKSSDNKFLLVIDEAHMYRGASGGEVSLLIRRLLDRLHIDPEQLKCILTSASMPRNGDKELLEFACNLTGKKVSKDTFTVIREELITNTGFKRETVEEATFLSSLSLGNLQADYDCQKLEFEKLRKKYHWLDVPADKKAGQNWLYDNLSKNTWMKQVVKVCNGEGKAFSQIAKETFESDVTLEMASKALENILQLGAMAKSDTNKVLLGSRVHMMFKGIQSLYACTNPDCPHGHSGMEIKLGYVTNEAREFCPCCHSRMFELMMDRQCGTLFLRAFIEKESGNTNNFEYLWARHNILMKEPQEVHLWILPKNRKDTFKLHKKSGKAKANSIAGCLYSKTGLLFRDEKYAGEEGYLDVLISNLYDPDAEAYSFKTCPNCGRDYNKVTPLLMRGNEPFANLVREQFESQVIKNASLKNEGKKVLLFSDSRQRAATLARDMTTAADGDAGRQAIFMAQKLLDESNGDNTLDLLYPAFLKVVFDNDLTFFYGDGKNKFEADLKKYKELYSQKKRVKFCRMKNTIGSPPEMFYQLLLKNISDYFRSFDHLGLGQIVLAETRNDDEDDEIYEDLLEPAERETGVNSKDIRLIYNAWIQYLVKRMALFPEIGDDVRNSILAYDRGGFGIDEKSGFPEYLKIVLKEYKKLSDEQLQKLFYRFLNITIVMNDVRSHNHSYIIGSRLQLKRAEHNFKWYRCDRCAGLSLFTLWGHCVHCGSNAHIHEVNEEQLQRFSLWRTPVLEALGGGKIRNITTEEHTAQLSYKDMRQDVWVTTEKYELAFRNITLKDDAEPIDILSCTTTMEVGIDIGSLTSVGLRNVPPMRENYQQRAGRAGRAGAAVSSIVTYTEDGPHDSWYFNHPQEIISGNPRIPWIDYDNLKLVKRHINLILLQEYLRNYNQGLDDIKTIDFFEETNELNYVKFIAWANKNIPLPIERSKILIPDDKFDWRSYINELGQNLNDISKKVKAAPYIYKEPDKESGARSNFLKLLDILFSEGLVPNYSFPRNIVHFWIEDKYGKIKESPERSLDIALSEYAPGRSLVVNKQTYISGGIYDYYTKFQQGKQLKAAEPWLELPEYNKTMQCCTNPLCGWFGVGKNRIEKCPLCHSKLETHQMIKPWGFTAREGRNIPETRESQEMSYASEPSYSTLSSSSKLLSVGTAGYIGLENRADQDLVMVNKGPEANGFEMCHICGAIEPVVTDQKARDHRKRPYRTPYSKDDLMKCRHDYHNVYLGYEFKTDMMVMEIELDNSKFDLESDYAIWLISALTTFAEALSLAASHELDVEFSDLKSGYRIRQSGINVYADVYLYDSLSSGAGYAARVAQLIDSVLDGMSEIFNGCSCSSSCPNCLQHFWNQRVKNNLDRFLGDAFLQFVRYGKLKITVDIKEQKRYFNEINQISEFQGSGEIITEKFGKYYLKTKYGEKEIVIYPAMCNKKSIGLANTICFSDRLCRYAISNVWQYIETWL